MEVVCAALAGVSARLACHPLDTIKTVTFTGFAGDHVAFSTAAPPPATSFLQSARCIWAREGVAGFYRGVGVAAVGAAPGVALYLGTYDWCCAAWKTFGDGTARSEGGDAAGQGVASATLQPLRTAAAASPSSLRFFVCGLAAEAVSCLVWVPIDVTKERLQSQPPALAGRYTGSLDAVQRVLRNEGVGGLYKGYASTLASFGPFSAVYFVFYEYFTATFTRLCTSGAPTSTSSGAGGAAEVGLPSSTAFAVALAAGAGGNVVASIITNPLELVKTRMQVQRAVLQRHSAAAPAGSLFAYDYRGLRQGLVTLAREEGVRALWRGVGSRVAYTAPNAALTMGLFEYLKRRLKS
ncbi:mitochondrial carrier protein [Novymonas esmeraldas]|uniref:Mitochondrial carrier protein n=1 Tax=Novymonas esmeraldas TaxID=1808958 RepID=A0AAW0F2N7_9TRYP